MRGALTAARNAKGLTQRALAARLSNAKIEGGAQHISVSDFIRIAHAMVVDPLSLLSRILKS